MDKCLAILFPDFSRSEWNEQISAGKISVNSEICNKNARRISYRDELAMDISDMQKPITDCTAEDIALDIVYEDEDLMVLNKPPDLVVHPGHGNRLGTLQSALLYHHPEADKLPRAGIVHRLDKDTSGLLVAAKNSRTQKKLIEKFSKREITREYLALVHGDPPATGIVNRPIGRSHRDPTMMAVNSQGKPAITRFAVEKNWRGFAMLRCWLESGRTHQIRVHLEYLGHPVVGDKQYSRRASRVLLGMTRQALHATVLRFQHPTDNRPCEWHQQLPDDMQQAIEMLEIA